MNEQLKQGGESPRLSVSEVLGLAKRAVVNGQRVDIDYSGIQPPEQPKPHAYIMEVDTAEVQAYKDELGNYEEEVTKAVLEYNEARLLHSNGPVLPAKIAITVESQIFSEINPKVLYEKDAIYTLMLDSQAQWEVTELYSEGKRSLHADLAASERASSNDPRPLMHEELSLLRLFL